ncbi:NRPS condensation-like uncharacterized protein [Anseongella ginsenosidimutans]|uniref:NRPS condensation-like uncharacterized protein n=1 Tax=Anseongella ginsenosidimutans TaxID=496056 RepID=A0A4R3KXY5_9SPHI|nr:hypothetical protein [Anseongella ginsenosidimutans]QEC51428.1 hypothetical protein FRZ59_03050 [Anseongella ginsenosidimutans]TCS89866.1 NRPS condensation-like uncharacterized protein [Anseongella ginsenosidimutans]
MTLDTEHNGDFWLRLDNAAKIYPAVKDRELTSVFRIAAQLKDRVKAKELLEAAHALERRFPYFNVKLKAGVFWYYLEPAGLPLIPRPDIKTPCRAFDRQELMFRILAREKTISVEFSHILTDGTGAFEFLKTLLFVYFEKCGHRLPPGLAYHRPEDPPSEEEYEDAYKKHFKRIDSRPPKRSKAFHLPFSLKRAPRFDLLTAVIPVKCIIEKAKAHSVSLTEYLTAVYLYSLQQIYRQQSFLKKRATNKILRIEVPINLRKLFPSRTMRNFSLYVIPGMDLRLGHYTFEEILKTVYHQMQLETDKKLISKMISRNVSGEKSPFVRGLPLFIKSVVLARLYTLGTKQYSGVVTNLGKIDLSEKINKLIDKFVFIPPPPNDILKVNCAVAGFDNQLVLTFGNITKSRELERKFLTFLTKEGVPVRLLQPYK